ECAVRERPIGHGVRQGEKMQSHDRLAPLPDETDTIRAILDDLRVRSCRLERLRAAAAAGDRRCDIADTRPNEAAEPTTRGIAAARANILRDKGAWKDSREAAVARIAIIVGRVAFAVDRDVTHAA